MSVRRSKLGMVHLKLPVRTEYAPLRRPNLLPALAA